MASRLLLLLTLLTAADAQQTAGCTSENSLLVCRAGSSRVEVLNETGTWRQAHERCRRRGRFLVPSDEARQALPDTLALPGGRDSVLGWPPGIEELLDDGFWAGVSMLRNGYYQWLLPTDGANQLSEEQSTRLSGVERSSLCGILTPAGGQLELNWTACADRRQIVCFSDDDTELLTMPASYKPSLTAQVGTDTVRPGTDGDTVLVRDLANLQQHQQQQQQQRQDIRLFCGDGDSIVKDRFVIGTTEFRSDQWPGDVTILRQIYPPDGGNRLTVGTFWCQRYVDGVVDPVTSGRLHVTTSEDMYVITAPRAEIVTVVESILANQNNPDQGSELFPYYRNGSLEAQLRDVLTGTESSEDVTLRYMALYDSFNTNGFVDVSNEGAPLEPQNETTRLLFDADFSTNHWISNYSDTYRNQTLQEKFRKVFKCEDERTGEHLWQQREWIKHRFQWRNPFASKYEFSEPACVASSGRALVGRRCMPQFDLGARWGAFCAAGVCSDSLPRCEPPPPHCPAGFQQLLYGSESGFDAPDDGPRRRACALLMNDVVFEDRATACWRREPTATLWSVRQSAALDRAVLSTIDRPMWLPFRRMWAGGPLWPTVASLVSEVLYEGGRPVTLEADLQTDLNCTVMTPDAKLRSVSCHERHAVVCLAPLMVLSGTLSYSSWFPQHGPCPSAGPRSVMIPGLSRCSAVICRGADYSPVAWSGAAGLCAESNFSLASMTSQRHLTIVARLQAPTADGDRRRAAVNLTRRDGRVVWGDGSELAYPALSPNLSTDEQHVQGVLDFSRGQYDFVGSDEPVVACAVCEQTVTSTAPEITLFYGSSLSETTIYANITDDINSSMNQNLYRKRRQSRAGILSCFVSTSQNGYQRYRVTTQRSSENQRTSTRFVRISPEVDFGYLLCGMETIDPVGIVMSNSLVLNKRLSIFRTEVEEYVVGVRAGRQQGFECDPTFCLNQCPCFNQSLENGEYRETEDGTFYQITLHPIRVTPSDERYGSVDTSTAHYFAVLDFNPPQRRRRRQAAVSEEPTPQTQQVPERPKARGMLLLRNEFGSQLDYIRPARCCPAERTEEPPPLRWPETCDGTATSEQLCVDDSGRPAQRRCRGGPLTGVRWEPVEFAGTRCAAASAVTTSLYRLSQTRVTAANAARTAAELAHLTAEPAALVLMDLVSVARILENIQAILQRRWGLPLPEDIAALQRSVVTAVSHVMDVDAAMIAEATESLRAGPRIVGAFERILVSSHIASMTTDNVAVRFGDSVGISSSSQDISNSSIQTVARGANSSEVFGVESALVLLDGLPVKSALFLVYRDGRLLHSSGQRVTSQVVSALLLENGPDEGHELHINVLMTFRRRPEAHLYPPVCAYWDFHASHWSTRGCWLETVRNDSDVCRCNHLTNFARIFNYETDVYLSRDFHRVLDIITYIGCALSLFGLLLTILTFVLFKNWRKFRGNQIVMHLSVALAGVYLTFLSGLAATENHFACIVLSALLHYFLLAAFGWMAVEAVFQYLRFVRVVGTYISRFMQKASLLAWGGSLIPVICVLAVDPQHYDGQREVCWMDFQSFFYALALPVIAVMVFNAVLFGRIVYSLNCGRQKGLRTNQPERQLALRRLRVSIVTFVLLGLPWLFGFLSIKEARLVFAVLFCVCSMLQGFAIFLLLVAGEGSVRGLWQGLVAGACCRCPFHLTWPSTGTGTASPATHSVTGSAPPTGPPSSAESEKDTPL